MFASMVTWAVENWFGVSLVQSPGLNLMHPKVVILVLESHPGMPDDS